MDFMKYIVIVCALLNLFYGFVHIYKCSKEHSLIRMDLKYIMCMQAFMMGIILLIVSVVLFD